MPKSRQLTCIFIGFEPAMGDTLLYRIVPDHHHKREATHYLVRSVVKPEIIPTFCTRLMGGLPPQI